MQFKSYRFFTKIPLLSKMMLGKRSPPFCIPGWLDDIKKNKYANYDSNIP